MKKILLLFVVLAVAACTTISAQNKVDRFFNNVDRAVARYERTEKAINRLERAIGIKDRIGRIHKEYDYKTGITVEKRRNVITSVYNEEVWIEIYDNVVEVFLNNNGCWVSSQFIPRDNYGTFKFTGLSLIGRRGVVLNVINNRERTMIDFRHGNTLVKSFVIKASNMQRYKY